MSASVCAALAAFASTSASAESWEYQVTPYAWMSGVSGTVGSLGLPGSEVDLSFADILDDLDYAGMLLASARGGPWVVYLDTTISKTTSTSSVGVGPVNSITVESKVSTLALALGRTLSSSPSYSYDAYIGARAWWLDNDFTVDTTAGSARASSDVNWVDPLIGIAGRYALSDRWTLFGDVEVGGFGVGSDLTWGFLAGATWNVNETFGVSFAWRTLAVDYEDDEVIYDVTQSGPVIGATFRF